MKAITLTALVAILISSGAWAYEAPKSLPIASEAVREAYAYTKVGQISAGVSGPSVSGTSHVSVPYKPDANPAHMAEVAAGISLKFEADPTKTLTSYVQYNGQVGNIGFTFFEGDREFSLFLTKGGHVVPDEAYDVELQLTDWLPVHIPGLSWAYMQTDDGEFYDFRQDGRLWNEEDILLIGRKHTGHSGTLYLGFDDGTQAIYDLGTGEQKSTELVVMTRFRVNRPGVRTEEPNTTEIVYQVGDRLISVRYDIEAKVRVYLPEKWQVGLPVAVYAIDTATLAQNPSAPWLDVTGTGFAVHAGQTVMIRYEAVPDPGQLPKNNGGKG